MKIVQPAISRLCFAISAVLFLFAAFRPEAAQGQLPQFYHDFTGNPNAWPFNATPSNGSNKIQVLFRPSDFNVTPPAGGMLIQAVYFKPANTVSFTYTNLTVKLGNTSLADATSGTWHSLTTVYSQPTQLLNAVANQWYKLQLQQPFLYTGGNFIIEFSQTTTAASNLLINQNLLSGTTRRMYGSTSSPASVSADGSLMALGFDALATATGPAGVNSGIQMWLDGSNINNTSPAANPAPGTALPVWRDVSGNGRDAMVLAGQSAPTMSTAPLNGKDVVKFTRSGNAAGSVYLVPGLDIRAAAMPQTTIFTVYRQGARAANELHGIWGNDNLDWDRFFMSTADGAISPATDGLVSVGLPVAHVRVPNAGVTGQTRLLTAVYDHGVPNGSTIYFNAQPVQTVTDGTDPLNAQSDLRIGWDGDDNPFNGDIAEMIVYNRKLSDCEIMAVNRYFGYKYGVNLSTASISPAGSVNFCGSQTLTASTGSTYQWLRNDSLIAGATGATHVASASGAYRVIIGNGLCADTSGASVLTALPPRLYVDASAPAGGTGAAWSTAKNSLAEALSLANGNSCVADIWVREGTYYPTSGTSRDSAFRMLRSGLKVYGGFAGNETALSQRTIAAHPTVLSGNIGAANDSTDNSYHVVTMLARPGAGLDSNTLLDGFTIRGGQATGGLFYYNGVEIINSDGGGVLCQAKGSGASNASRVENCIFKNNYAAVGGGMYVGGYQGGVNAPAVRNCVFDGNRGIDIGGLHSFSGGTGAGATPVVTNTIFRNNSAGNGGAMGSYSTGGNGSYPVVTACVFEGNTATAAGGAIRIITGSFTVTNTVFAGNSTTGASGAGGGAIYVPGGQNALLNSCTFYNNTTASTGQPAGNALTVANGAGASLSNSIVWGTAPLQVAGSVSVNHSLVRGMSLSAPNLSADPLFTNAGLPAGADGQWATADDGLHLLPCSPAINAAEHPLVPALSTDIAGSLRVQQGVAEMGAYEMPFAPTGLPDISIARAASRLCVGDTLNFTASLTAAGSPVAVTWYRNGTQVQSGSATSFTSSTLSPNDTVWAVLYNAACGLYDTSNRMVIQLAAVPASPASISGPSAVCAGTNAAYAVVPVAGATSYTWSLPVGWLGASTSNNINAAPSLAAGSVSVVASNVCGSSAPVSLAVTSAQVPAAPAAITGAATFCPGVAQSYSVAAVSGATAYLWTLPPGWSAASQLSSISTTPGTMGGVVAVAASNYCGTSAAATLAVNGAAAPASPGAIAGPTALCAGVASTFSVAAIPGAVSYSWTLPTGWSGSSTSNTITVTPVPGSGTITLTAANSCGTSAAGPALVVSAAEVPAQPGLVSGAAAVCAGVQQTYAVAPVPGAVTYTWSLPSGWSGTSDSVSILVNPGAVGGAVQVKAANYCGASAFSAPLTVSAATVPSMPGPISGPAALCAGAVRTYAVPPVSGATGYHWSLGGSISGASQADTISITAAAGTGTLTITASNYCGTSAAAAPVAIAVAAVPAAPGAPTGTQAVCAGTTHNYSVTAVAGATSYNWSLPAGWSAPSLTTAQPVISATAGPTAVGGNIAVTAANTCGISAASAALAVTVAAIPAQPGPISGAAAVCVGTSQNYSVAAVSGASSYLWSMPSGWSGTAGSGNAATVMAGGSGTGTVTVAAVNACGTSALQSLAVTTTALPAQPGVISGAASLCAGSTQLYGVAAVAGATHYIWTLPAGWGGASATPALNTVAGTAGGNLSVAAANSCGSGPVRNLAVSVTNVPAQPAAISGQAALCYGASPAYSIPAVSGATGYAWTMPAGWTANGATSGTAVTLAPVNASGGVLSVVAFNNCGAGQPRTLIVSADAYPQVVISPQGTGGVISLCVGDTVRLSALQQGGGTQTGWQWYFNGNPLIGGNDSTWRAHGQGNYQVVATTANGCRDTAQVSATATFTVPVIVNVVASPGVNIVPGQAVTFTAMVTNGGANPQWRWYRNGIQVTGVSGNVYVSSNLADGDLVWAWVKSDRTCTDPDTASSRPLRMRMPTAISGTAAGSTEGVRLYPNPTGGRFTVQREAAVGSSAGGQVEIAVINGLGQVAERRVAERSTDGSWKMEVALKPELANGVYHLRVVERDAAGAVLGERPLNLPFVLQR